MIFSDIGMDLNCHLAILQAWIHAGRYWRFLPAHQAPNSNDQKTYIPQMRSMQTITVDNNIHIPRFLIKILVINKYK